MSLPGAIFRIRPAVRTDSVAICAVHKASVRGLCAPAYTPEQIEAWVGLRVPADYRRLISGRGTIFVAERDGAVVGFASIRGGSLQQLYVDPENGRGAGAPLLRAAEDLARRRGIKRIRLSATLVAVSFYLARGYTRHGVIAHAFNGMALPAVSMSKVLE